MRERLHLTVMPGGFVEVSGQTDASEVRYTGTYSYWQRRAREHGYRVVLALLYGGTEFYWQPQTGKDWRVRLALQNVPCAMPVPRILAKPPLIFLRELELPLDLDEAGIHALRRLGPAAVTVAMTWTPAFRQVLHQGQVAGKQSEYPFHDLDGEHNTTQHNTTQHNTTQHNTTQHNTTHFIIHLGEHGT